MFLSLLSKHNTHSEGYNFSVKFTPLSLLASFLVIHLSQQELQLRHKALQLPPGSGMESVAVGCPVPAPGALRLLGPELTRLGRPS